MDTNKNYLAIQIDEIESLQSIYERELTICNEERRIFEIKLEIEKQFATLRFTLPNEYPDSPPICEIGIPWVRGKEKNEIDRIIENIVFENFGNPVVYVIVESVREELTKNLRNYAEELKIDNEDEIKTRMEKDNSELGNLLPVFHGETLVDRKSTFQAHVAQVNSELEVEVIRNQLLSNGKIAMATHNISAYRIKIKTPNGVDKLIQSCDDDGENKASERLLNMMVLMGIENVFVVVSRWYGGIKLGPDRFKHINNVAKDAIMQCGWFSLKSNH